MSPMSDANLGWVSTVGAWQDHHYQAGSTKADCGYEGRHGNEPKPMYRPKCKHCLKIVRR
jgi:hypothetical protein